MELPLEPVDALVNWLEGPLRDAVWYGMYVSGVDQALCSCLENLEWLWYNVACKY